MTGQSGSFDACPLSCLFFRPPGSLPETWKSAGENGSNRWGKPHVILPFEEEGQCRCEVSRSFATQPQQGLRLGFAGIWMPPRPHLSDTAAHKGKQGLFSLHSGRWCSLCQRCRNSALGGTRISSLCHSALGPQKWVRASARNCGWRIAGRDACPTRGWEEYLSCYGTM